MFKEIKKYIRLLSLYNNESNLAKITNLWKKLEVYQWEILSTPLDNLENILHSLDAKFPIWLYFDYENVSPVENEYIINNTTELQRFLIKNIPKILETWGLNCYVDIDNPGCFLQLHYQNHIIKYYIEKTKK